MLNHKPRVAFSGIPGWIGELQKGAKINSVPAELITEGDFFLFNTVVYYANLHQKELPDKHKLLHSI